MSAFSDLLAATAFAAAVLGVLAFLRRLTRSATAPRFLENPAVTGLLALVSTIVIVAAMHSLGLALMPITGSIGWTLIAVVAGFAVLWSVIRVIVPLRDAMPVAGQAITGAPVAPLA